MEIHFGFTSLALTCLCEEMFFWSCQTQRASGSDRCTHLVLPALSDREIAGGSHPLHFSTFDLLCVIMCVCMRARTCPGLNTGKALRGFWNPDDLFLADCESSYRRKKLRLSRSISLPQYSNYTTPVQWAPRKKCQSLKQTCPSL